VRGDSFWSSAHPEYSKIFDVQKYFITAKKEPDMDELAESDVECMLLAIEENKTLNFGQLKEKSHQSAWNNAISNAKKDENNFDNEISFIDIAKEANADEEMLRYIVLNLENQSIFDYAEVQ
jgi:hypothetical protein